MNTNPQVTNPQVTNPQVTNPQATAMVHGEPFIDLPNDLYIPTEALTLTLDSFTGPMDLLLYLIKKQNIDILDIPISLIADQYGLYISKMDSLSYELAGDYLLMAALLADIKTKMLLPRQVSEQEEEDPRAELARRLAEYERYRIVAKHLSDLPRLERDIHLPAVEVAVKTIPRSHPDVTMDVLFNAYQSVMKRASLTTEYLLRQDPLTIRDCTTMVIKKLKAEGKQTFSSILDVRLGRMGVTLTFLSLLLLAHQQVISINQEGHLGDIAIELLIANWSLPTSRIDHDMLEIAE